MKLSGLADAFGFLLICGLAIGGGLRLTDGWSREGAVAFGLGVIGLAVFVLRRRRRPDAGVDEPPAVGVGRLRGRTALATACGLLAAITTGFLMEKVGLSGRGDATVLPPLPIPPPGTVEYRGRTSDGMQMVLWRNRRTIWIRVDSAESEGCGIGKNFAQRSLELNPTGDFRGRWEFESTATFSRPLFGLIVAIRDEQTLPKRVRVDTYGELLPHGRAEGRFTRRDVVTEDGKIALDCTRSVDWTARTI